MFGCFATDSWRLGPKFYGKPESFLFQLAPTMGVYETTPFNSNYQYFNLKQKTMPNGLGMGGQVILPSLFNVIIDFIIIDFFIITFFIITYPSSWSILVFGSTASLAWSGHPRPAPPTTPLH